MNIKEIFWRLKFRKVFGLQGAFDRNFLEYQEARTNGRFFNID